MVRSSTDVDIPDVHAPASPTPAAPPAPVSTFVDDTPVSPIPTIDEHGCAYGLVLADQLEARLAAELPNPRLGVVRFTPSKDEDLGEKAEIARSRAAVERVRAELGDEAAGRIGVVGG